MIEFTAHVSPTNGTLEITPDLATTRRGMEAVNVVQDNTAGSGPAQSVELVTTFTGFDGDCGVLGTFCGDVTIRSFYSFTLTNVYSELTAIIPATNHDSRNSDPAPPGLSDTFGLWSYGALAPAGSNNRLWIFGDDGIDYIVRGRVMADLPITVGCSDGQREGFVDMVTHPRIAGCSGGWSVPGIDASVSVPACGRVAGDDSANPTGTGCSVNDICAVGWHVCNSNTDVVNNSGTGDCTGVTQANDPSLFFAQRISGSGSGNCIGGANYNDVFGCGNHGATTPLNCPPLNRFSHNNCSGLQSPPWYCNGTGYNEAQVITKSTADFGGVLCCRD